MNEFGITMEDSSNISCEYAAQGAINAKSSGQLEGVLTKCLDQGRVNIRIDMSKVTFLSSLGIRVVLNIYKKAKKKGGRLQILRPSECVRNVIGMTALDELLF